MNDYATLAELKAKLDITDTTDDTELQSVLSAVSRAIDEHCGRFFYRETQTRVYTAWDSEECWIDDLVSVSASGLKTDDNQDRTYEYTWATTDYDLWPFNAALKNWPYDLIQVAPQGSYSFPTHAKGVQVTGVFGWPSVPGPVHEACLLWAERVWKARDAIFGVMGTMETGMIRTSMDPQIEMLLHPYMKAAIYG